MRDGGDIAGGGLGQGGFGGSSDTGVTGFGYNNDEEGFTKAMKDAWNSYWGMRPRARDNFNRQAIQQGYGDFQGMGPSPLDPMSAGIGRRGIAPPNWAGFDTQQGYGDFQGLNPLWGNWDQQQANVGALKGWGPWSNVRTRFEPMSGGSINRTFEEPDNRGGER